MAFPAETVGILGLGLIGGSLASALRESGFSQQFIGYGYRDNSLRRGVELGVIDDFTLDLDELIERSDILVICAPTLVAADLLVQILQRTADMESGPVITDAASVKGSLLTAARATCGGELPPADADLPGELPEWAHEFASSWGQFFLKFILSHPAVTCVIPATSKPHHMIDNLGAGIGEMPDAATRKRMADFFAGV